MMRSSFVTKQVKRIMQADHVVKLRSPSQSVTLSSSPRGISRGRSYATGFASSQPLSRASRSSMCLVVSKSVMKLLSYSTNISVLLPSDSSMSALVFSTIARVIVLMAPQKNVLNRLRTTRRDDADHHSVHQRVGFVGHV